jgi:hypothetical protein
MSADVGILVELPSKDAARVFAALTFEAERLAAKTLRMRNAAKALRMRDAGKSGAFRARRDELHRDAAELACECDALRRIAAYFKPEEPAP